MLSRRVNRAGPAHERSATRAHPSPLLGAVAVALAAFAGTASAARADLALGPGGLREQRRIVELRPGLTWTRIVRGGHSRRGSGPWVVNVLSVDRATLAGRLSAALARGQVAGLERTSATARRTGAPAGVNGGFYVGGGTGQGDPVGVLTLREELVSETIDGRSALFLPRSPAAPAQVDVLRFRGSVRLGELAAPLDGVNRVLGRIPSCGGRGGDRPTERPRHGLECRDPSELILFSSRFGARTPRQRGVLELVVRGGAAAGTARGGATTIPGDGFVLAASGAARALLEAGGRGGAAVAVETALLRAGSPVRLSDYEAIVGVGPRIVSRGRIVDRTRREGFRGDAAFYRSFVTSRNPRTLIGLRGNRVLLVTVDGRQRRSAGVSLREAARLMRSLGSTEAVNLDGGGSTAMTVGGRVVNRPSDPKGERAVGDGIFVLPPG